MLDWIKEHKQYAIGAFVLIIALLYYLFTTYVHPPTYEEENWDIETNSEVDLQSNTAEDEAVDEEILVDVKGAVQKPGVYKATIGERVIDLIERAGGVTEQANSLAINFAQKVSDEMVVYVPSVGEEETMTSQSNTSTGGATNSDKINLNKASQAELETLPGIGPSKAQAIIEYRETNGPFKSIEEIMSISGFGEKTFEKLKESISVN